ncbi:hypothetical protein Trco_006639 [Trichoderma cornu-damae]|uniref:Uncharacterized protein n=1 Tax=Trichoderma cornu-damae TaxID=654480 RepID=A0A9P8QM80_9HYPO|nr:hypothetical protein Trco_006639 [Trichoderma cornu-damae]
MPEPSGHIHLQQQCSACGDAFSCKEAFVSVLRSGDSVTVVGSYEFPFGRGATDALNDRTGRTFTHCRPCVPCESATIHADCFDLFRRSCTHAKGLHRLLRAAVWRSPWHGAPKFKVCPEVDVHGSMLLAARACHLPELASMPPEIMCMIWRDAFAQPSLLGRYQSVVALAAESCDQDPDQQTSLSVCNVASWERGGRPLVEERDAPPFIRITIDRRGVRRIERLVQRPEFLHRRSDTELYIVETREAMAGVDVLFQSGLARLDLARTEVDLRPWDTRTPPPLESLSVRPAISKSIQFATIHLARITGITFFMSAKSGTVFAIHTHTSQAPSAVPTFSRLSKHQQWQACWIHVPFTSGDRLTHFGVRHVDSTSWHILVMKTPSCRFRFRGRTCPNTTQLRFEKAGDYIIGPHFEKDEEVQDSIWPVEDQLLLVCSISRTGSVLALNAFPQRSGTAVPPFAQIDQIRLPPAFTQAFFSSAPLENVVRLRVFTDHAKCCRGLLLEYEDGSKRSVGECRIGVDRQRVYRSPACICIFQEATELYIKACYRLEHKHVAGDWTVLDVTFRHEL